MDFGGVVVAQQAGGERSLVLGGLADRGQAGGPRRGDVVKADDRELLGQRRPPWAAASSTPSASASLAARIALGRGRAVSSCAPARRPLAMLLGGASYTVSPLHAIPACSSAAR